MFFSTTAVVMAEVFKTVGCLVIIFCQEGFSFHSLLDHLNRVSKICEKFYKVGVNYHYNITWLVVGCVVLIG